MNIETLQSLAWMYLVVFIFALIAYVIVKGFALKHSAAAGSCRDDLPDTGAIRSG